LERIFFIAEKLLQEFQQDLTDKMKKHNDTFPRSKWYKKNWIENRVIIKTATLNPDKN
jgi:hypothetical protein